MTENDIKRVAGYVRVSTEEQNHAMQASDIRKLAELRGWELVTIVEEKASGAKLRPARQKLMADATAGACDAIVVWKLDRWGRGSVDLQTSVEDLITHGVQFVSVRDNIDATTASGKLFLQLLAAFAEFERAQLRERVTAGLRHAKRHGTRTGRAIGRPATSAERAPRVHALVAKGVRLPEIARRLEMPYSTVHRIAQAVLRHK